MQTDWFTLLLLCLTPSLHKSILSRFVCRPRYICFATDATFFYLSDTFCSFLKHWNARYDTWTIDKWDHLNSTCYLLNYVKIGIILNWTRLIWIIKTRLPKSFFVTRPPKGGCCNPLRFSLQNTLYLCICYQFIPVGLLLPLISKKYHICSFDVTVVS